MDFKLEFFDSGQRLSVGNFSMELLMQDKDDSLSNCYSYPLDGHFESSEGNYQLSPTNIFFSHFSKTSNKSDVPFNIPSQLSNNIKRKFENFTKYVNSKENEFGTDSVEQWNQMNRDYADFINPPKEYSCVSNSIASYLIGGFVGSKSQMNNEKHKLSFDLGDIIFKVLNGWKSENKLIEKMKDEKKLDGNKMNCKKLKNSFMEPNHFADNCNLYLYNEILDKNNIVDDELLDSALKSLPVEHDFEIKLCHALCSTVDCNSSTETFDSSNEESHSSSLIEECMGSSSNNIESLNASIEESNNKNTDLDIKNKLNEALTLPKCSDSVKISTSFATSETAPLSDSMCSVNSNSNLSSQRRTRQYSDCSIESTDSESFIVFDAECCDNDEFNCTSDVEDSDFSFDDEDETDDSDNSVHTEIENTCDISDDEIDSGKDDEDDYDTAIENKKIADANARWSELYKNVPLDDEDGSETKVKFDDHVKIHKMVAWNFAYRAARLGPWEQMMRDRIRFKERIQQLSTVISPVLNESHRKSIYDKLHG